VPPARQPTLARAAPDGSLLKFDSRGTRPRRELFDGRRLTAVVWLRLGMTAREYFHAAQRMNRYYARRTPAADPGVRAGLGFSRSRRSTERTSTPTGRRSSLLTHDAGAAHGATSLSASARSALARRTILRQMIRSISADQELLNLYVRGSAAKSSRTRRCASMSAWSSSTCFGNSPKPTPAVCLTPRRRPDLIQIAAFDRYRQREITGAGIFNRHYHVIDDDITNTQLKDTFDFITCVSSRAHRECRCCSTKHAQPAQSGGILDDLPYNERALRAECVRLGARAMDEVCPILHKRIAAPSWTNGCETAAAPSSIRSTGSSGTVTTGRSAFR
jgi:hypothetical protein